MIFHEVAQNTPDWITLRLGIPCSSEFHRIMTPKKMQVSSQAPSYMYRLLAEWVTGEPVENFASQWMDRGHELEEKAVLAYEMLTDTETQPGGFITTDDGLMGCSPDRLVGNTGDLELKCPLIQTQIEYALTGSVGEDYLTQLQGRLMIHGREWVDIFAYHPRLSIPPLRVYRDEKFIENLSAVTKVFVEKMLQFREELDKRFGPFVRAAEIESDGGKHFLNDADLEMLVGHHQENTWGKHAG